MSHGYWTSDEIRDLVERFENCTWPCQDWTHEAHLVMGIWFASQYPEDQLTDLIRQRIKRYNISCGGQNTETAGYHETITRFYVWYIRRFLDQSDPALSIEDRANEFCRSHADKELPLRYYSKARLMSSEARISWVEPDLNAII